MPRIAPRTRCRLCSAPESRNNAQYEPVGRGAIGGRERAAVRPPARAGTSARTRPRRSNPGEARRGGGASHRGEGRYIGLRQMSTDTNTASRPVAEDAAERLLRDVRIDTKSDQDSETYPEHGEAARPCCAVLEELRSSGSRRGDRTTTVRDRDAAATSTATLPGNRGLRASRHGARCKRANVKPQRIRYDGGDVSSEASGQGSVPESRRTGSSLTWATTIIKTDGTTCSA